MARVPSSRWSELARALPEGPLTYHPPREHHGHWSVTDAAGREVLCPHTPPTPEVVALLTRGLELIREEAGSTPEPAAPTPLDLAWSGRPALAAAEAGERAGNPVWNLRPLRKVTKFLRRQGMAFGEIVAIVADPEGTEPGRDGATIYVARGLRVVVGSDGETVLAVYPVGEPERAEPPVSTGPPMPRVPGTKADRRVPVPTDRTDFVALLRSRGFDVVDGGKHQRITHEDHPGLAVTLPSTPSDHRWAQNTIAEVRAVFGIDLRQPAPGR
ncbi:hypothetical protein [Rothia kristinae]|uniref:hypothetical protein n=1 Tax=Rothia kristinae TaxID=37923 RepID=UPI0033C92811